jgi:hypothetical protein
VLPLRLRNTSTPSSPVSISGASVRARKGSINTGGRQWECMSMVIVSFLI